MGRKGDSKRKAKKVKQISKPDATVSSILRGSDLPLVSSSAKDNGAFLNRGGLNPSAGSGKKHKKGN